MGQLPAILKEIKNPDSAFHIGGVLSFMEPLCKKFSEDEIDITGWVSNRDWNPGEKFYAQGLAWKLPSART